MSAAEQQKEAEVESSDSEPEQTEVQQDGKAAPQSRLSRGEKKSRKAMQKLGLKPVEGVIRVTVKRNKSVRLLAARSPPPPPPPPPSHRDAPP